MNKLKEAMARVKNEAGPHSPLKGRMEPAITGGTSTTLMSLVDSGASVKEALTDVLQSVSRGLLKAAKQWDVDKDSSEIAKKAAEDARSYAEQLLHWIGTQK